MLSYGVGTYLYPGHGEVSAFPQENSCHQVFYMNGSCSIRRIPNKNNTCQRVKKKSAEHKRRYLKDFVCVHGILSLYKQKNNNETLLKMFFCVPQKKINHVLNELSL